MIFRDDDISRKTKVEELKPIHDLFIKYNVVHTIAVICKDLDHNPEIINYINNSTLFDVQFHCYCHQHNMTGKKIEVALEIFEGAFDKRPTVFYPPWNYCDPELEAHVNSLDMQVSNEKVSLHQYIARMGKNCEVVNFHYWHKNECDLLETALRIFKGEIK